MLLTLWGALTPSGRVISVSLLAISILYGGGKQGVEKCLNVRVSECLNVGMLECLNVGMVEWGFRRFRRFRRFRVGSGRAR
jgi:hypothetical protein